jgi:hypothetical protein
VVIVVRLHYSQPRQAFAQRRLPRRGNSATSMSAFARDSATRSRPRRTNSKRKCRRRCQVSFGRFCRLDEMVLGVVGRGLLLLSSSERFPFEGLGLHFNFSFQTPIRASGFIDRSDNLTYSSA